MKQKIEKILEIWHKHFLDEEKQYSEFESSDIEYFVGCMLYNHFGFSKALESMKTMDLSYDFLSSCDDEYDEIRTIMKSIIFENEEQSLAFYQEYIHESQMKYTKPERYLLDRLAYHIDALAGRYKQGDEIHPVDFQNPLYR